MSEDERCSYPTGDCVCFYKDGGLADRLDAVTKERDEAKGLADAYLEGSAEWEESFHQAKALEKAAIQKGQRHKVERDALKAKCEKYEEALRFTVNEAVSWGWQEEKYVKKCMEALAKGKP